MFTTDLEINFYKGQGKIELLVCESEYPFLFD